MTKSMHKGVFVTELLPITKPTLLVARRAHDIPSRTIAETAGVSLADEYLMEIGGMVSEEIATKVLAAFSKLTGTTYTLADISVSVKPHITI